MPGRAVDTFGWARVIGACVALGGAASPQVGVAQPAAESAADTPVSLSSSDGVSLFAAYRPGRAGGPAVVLVHQNGRDHEEWAFLEDSLQRGGYHVLAVDLRGHGKSMTQAGKTLDPAQFTSDDFRAMTHDVEAAVTWLRGRPDVDSARIALVGASLGANLVLAYAAGDPRIDHVAMLSPGLDYKGVTTEDAIQRYGARALFMAVSREDNYSAKSVLVLDASSPSAQKEMKIFTGAGHGSRMLNREPSLETALLTWLNEPVASSAVGGPPSMPSREPAADMDVAPADPSGR